MCSMQQVRLAALFLLVVALSAGAQALAEDSRTFPLDNLGAEPLAEGQATLTNVTLLRTERWDGEYRYYYSGQLSVTCTRLTPHKIYLIAFPDGPGLSGQWMGRFKTDRDGAGGISNLPVTWVFGYQAQGEVFVTVVPRNKLDYTSWALQGSTWGWF